MANRIKQLRQERHMTQTRLSIELEVSQETVSAYESERYFPSFPVLVQLSLLLDASIDYMMGLSDVRHPQPSDLPREQAELLRRYVLLDNIQKAKVSAYIEGMLAQSSFAEPQ